MSMYSDGVNAFTSGVNAASEGGLRLSQAAALDAQTAKQQEELQAMRALMAAREQAVQGASGLATMPDPSSYMPSAGAGPGGPSVPTAALTATQADSAAGTPGYGASAASGYSSQGAPDMSSSMAAPSVGTGTTPGADANSGMTSPEQAILNSKYQNFLLTVRDPNATPTARRDAEEDVRGYRYRTAMRSAQQYLQNNSNQVDHILGGMMHASTTSGRSPMQIVKGIDSKTGRQSYTITIDGKTDKLTSFEASHLAAAMVTHGVDPEMSGAEMDNVSTLVGTRMGVLNKDHIDTQNALVARQTADANTTNAGSNAMNANTNRGQLDLARQKLYSQQVTPTSINTIGPNGEPMPVAVILGTQLDPKTNKQSISLTHQDGTPFDPSNPQDKRVLDSAQNQLSDRLRALSTVYTNYQTSIKQLEAKPEAAIEYARNGQNPAEVLLGNYQAAVQYTNDSYSIREKPAAEQLIQAQALVDKAIANKQPRPTAGRLQGMGFSPEVAARAVAERAVVPKVAPKVVPPLDNPRYSAADPSSVPWSRFPRGSFMAQSSSPVQQVGMSNSGEPTYGFNGKVYSSRTAAEDAAIASYKK